MPIDYKKYPNNWKTEIRPRILKRADNKCEFCGVPNHIAIFRCNWDGVESYQTSDGKLYDANTSELIGEDTESWYLEPLHKDKAIKVVLTIMHLNHDISDNRDENLKASCQRCHLRYDAKHHAETRRNKKDKSQLNLGL